MMPERKPHPSIQPLQPQSGETAVSWRSPQQAELIIAAQPPVPPPNPLYLTAGPVAAADEGTIDISSQVLPEDRRQGDSTGDSPTQTVDWVAQASSPDEARDPSDALSDSVDRFEAGWFEDECAIADLFDPEAWASVQPVATNSLPEPESGDPESGDPESGHPRSHSGLDLALDESAIAKLTGVPPETAAQENTADPAAATTADADLDPDATTLYRRHTAGPLTYFNYYFEEAGSGTAASSPASAQWTWRLLGAGAVAVTVVSGLMIGDAWQKSRSPEEATPKDAAAPTPSTDLTRSPAPLPQGTPTPAPAASSVAPERLPTPPAPAPSPTSHLPNSPAHSPLPRQSTPEMPMMTRVAPPEMVAIAPTPANAPNLPPPIAEVRPTLPPPDAELRPALPPPPDMTPPPLPPPIVPTPAPPLPTVASVPAEPTGASTTAALPQSGQRSWVRRNILQMSLAEAARRQAELAGEVPPAPSDAPPTADRDPVPTTPLPPDSGFGEVDEMSAIPRSTEAAGLRRLFPERSPDSSAISSGDRHTPPEDFPTPRVPETVPNSLPVAILESSPDRIAPAPAEQSGSPLLQRVVGIQDFVQMPRPGSRPPDGNGTDARPISILPLTEQAATEALGRQQISGFAVRSLPRQDYQREWATSNKLDEASSAIAYPAFGFIDYQRQMIVVLQGAINAATPTTPLPAAPSGQLPPQS